MGNGKQERIIVKEGDVPEVLAENFAE